MWLQFLLVFLGGGLGSVSRYLISLSLPLKDEGFPLATFSANAVACLIAGFLASSLSKTVAHPSLNFLMLIGFCGGFSTFSSFSVENLKLINKGAYSLAVFYTFSSLLVCILATFGGFWLGKK